MKRVRLFQEPDERALGVIFAVPDALPVAGRRCIRLSARDHRHDAVDDRASTVRAYGDPNAGEPRSSGRLSLHTSTASSRGCRMVTTH